jgi:hypothetical protein
MDDDRLIDKNGQKGPKQQRKVGIRNIHVGLKDPQNN